MSIHSDNKTVAAYGSWPSHLNETELLSKAGQPLEVKLYQGDIYCLESRPSEAGRSQICRITSGKKIDILPESFSARSRVHEYGGAPWAMGNDCVFFVNQADQQIYQIHIFSVDVTAHQLTFNHRHRYADLVYDKTRHQLLAVCEQTQQGEEPIASIVSIALNKATDHDASDNTAKRQTTVDNQQTTTAEGTPVQTLCQGADFYAFPRISPCGNKLCWIQWYHPNMPWDSTQLYQADIDINGVISNLINMAGSTDPSQAEAIFQPDWSPQSELVWVSDQDNWWNLYRCHHGEKQQLTFMDADIGLPLWQFGMSTWGFVSDSDILFCATQHAEWKLYRISTHVEPPLLISAPETIACLDNHIQGLQCSSTRQMAVFIGNNPTATGNLYSYNHQLQRTFLIPDNIEANVQQPTATSHDNISVAVAFSFQQSEHQVEAFYYAPTHAKYQGPEGQKPPLICLCHGGPTGSTHRALNSKIQFWSSRGFAVVDVNYRGSTGYGRAYRQSLYGQWGKYDVEDACAAVDYCIEQGWADSNKCIIRGSSAGGYTVLSALCFSNRFNAGTSLYGISDLNALIQDTHKFESRYTHRLIAEATASNDTVQAICQARSPIHHVENFHCPILFLQGALDKVVPPNQAHLMVDALKSKHIPVAIVEYSNEAHGFRDNQNILHSLTSELEFYGKIFDFEPDMSTHSLNIFHFDQLAKRQSKLEDNHSRCGQQSSNRPNKNIDRGNA